MELSETVAESSRARVAGAASERIEWGRTRRLMENGSWKYTPLGTRRRRQWVFFQALLRLFGLGLKLAGLYQRGLENAIAVRLTRLDLAFADLPAAFDGFRILQLSDLHVDALPGTFEAALDLTAGLEVDLCVLTGDYRRRTDGPFEHILAPLGALVSGVRTREGCYAILGNHDCADMVPGLERLGITVLINQSRSLERAGARLHLTGTDDVHYYFTEAAHTALARAPEGFKIALVHSAELAGVAAQRGFRLYLAGHTHGGQVCLPGGRPIFTHLSCHRGYASGLWRHGGMLGYTTTGVGVSGLPIRFNSRGEVALITLRRHDPKESGSER